MEVLVSLLRACMAPRWITSSLGGTTSSVFLTHLELLKSELLVDGPVRLCSSRRMLGDAPTNQPSVQGAENPASPSPEMYLSSTRPQGLCHPVAVAMHTVQEGRLAITRDLESTMYQLVLPLAAVALVVEHGPRSAPSVRLRLGVPQLAPPSVLHRTAPDESGLAPVPTRSE